MTEGSIISIGVKWLMAPDCSQVSEKKSFSLGSSSVIPPSSVIGTAGGPVKVNGDGAPLWWEPWEVCRGQAEGRAQPWHPFPGAKPAEGIWQDPGRNHMAEGRDWNV